MSGCKTGTPKLSWARKTSAEPVPVPENTPRNGCCAQMTMKCPVPSLAEHQGPSLSPSACWVEGAWHLAELGSPESPTCQVLASSSKTAALHLPQRASTSTLTSMELRDLHGDTHGLGRCRQCGQKLLCEGSGAPGQRGEHLQRAALKTPAHKNFR